MYSDAVWSAVPLKRLDHVHHVGLKVLNNRRERILIRHAVEIERGAEEMAGGVGEVELKRRRRVAMEFVIDAIHVLLRVVEALFGYGRGFGCVLEDEVLRVERQLPQVTLYWLVGAMDAGIERGITDVQPVLFAGTTYVRARLGGGGILEAIGIVGAVEHLIGMLRQFHAEITVRLRHIACAAGGQSQQNSKEYYGVNGFDVNY